MKKFFSILVVALLFTAQSATAQIKTPAPSPVCKINQEFGLVKVDIEYSRPSARGRKVFGDLVLFGEMWRTGANASTKVSFSDEVSVGGVKLPAKQYALYAIPGQAEWTIIFYKNTEFWGVPGKDFKEEDVAARFTVPSMSTKETVESLTIDLNNLRNNSADLIITWENTKVIVPIKVDTDTRVLADIKTQIEGPSASTYYQAGRYYFEEKKDLNQALEWVTKSLEKGGDKFWILQMKAKILAELGRYKDAIATAEKSSELARTEGNTDYPRANDKFITEWKKK
jgi:Protein of unknown function (DUF2911)